MLVTALGGRSVVLVCALRLHLLCQFPLFGVVDADIAQPELFPVHDVVHRAEDLQDAVERQGIDALHAGDEILPLVGGNVAAEGELFQGLVAAFRLYGGTDDDLVFPAVHDAVVVEIGRDKISDVRFDGQDLFRKGAHRVGGQIDDRMAEDHFLPPVYADGYAGKIADHPAQVNIIDVFHGISSKDKTIIT